MVKTPVIFFTISLLPISMTPQEQHDLIDDLIVPILTKVDIYRLLVTS